MSNPDPTDIGKPLDVPSDEEAVAIMEGRLPAVDMPETDEAALAIARGLLAEPDEVSSRGAGGKVVELFARQPWMRMAAAMVLGIAVATLISPTLDVARQNSGLASANVIYLDTVRGADSAQLPTIELGGEPYVTLVAYPDFSDSRQLDVRVERAVGPDESPDTAIRRDQWVVVFETTTGVGNADSIVVNVAAAALQPGLHRLRIESESALGAGSQLINLFRVTR